MDRSPASIERRLADMSERCRAAGMSVTPQRLAVYKALLIADDHPTPEQIYQRVQKQLPSLSFATVYKILEALKQLGLADEVSPVSDRKRFDANDHPHHHLVCTRCEKVSDFYDAKFDELRAPRKIGGFVAQSLRVQIQGLCAECARRR